MMIFLLLLMMFEPNHVLVLKNKKKIVCDAFTRDNGRVTVERKGQTFSLPASAIDWDASASATERYRAQQAAKAEAEAAEAARQDEGSPYLVRDTHRPPEGDIVLTNRDYHERIATKAPDEGPVEIDLRRVGNSLLIDVSFNGYGPYTLVLDTGASTTTVSSKLAEETGLIPTGESVMVAGVGGVSTADLAKSETIAVAHAQVPGMTIAVHDIPALNQGLGASGLLGQDFLNHFSVTLDGDRLTLEKSAAATTTDAATIEVGKDLLERAPELSDQVETLFANIRQLSEDFQVTDPLKNGSEKARACRELLADLQKTNAFMERIQGALKNAEVANAAGINPRARDTFNGCVPKFRELMNTMNSYIRDLQWSYNNVDSQEKVNAERQRILTDFRGLFNAYNGLASCLRLRSLASDE